MADVRGAALAYREAEDGERRPRRPLRHQRVEGTDESPSAWVEPLLFRRGDRLVRRHSLDTQIFLHAGIAADRVGTVVAIPYAAAGFAMVWWCRHSDRKQERVWHIVAASLAACLGLSASAVLVESPLLCICAISIAAAGTLAILPIFWTLPSALLRGAAAAGAIALINSLGNLGGFAGPYLIGWIRNATGSFTWGLLAAAGGVLMTGIIALRMGHDALAEHGEPAAVA